MTREGVDRAADVGQLVELLPDAVVVIDRDGTVQFANRAAERAIGKPRDGWVGSAGLDLVHPDDWHLAALSLESVQHKDVGSPIELRLATAGGWRLVELLGAPIGDGQIALSIRDLTERRRWEVAGDEVALFRSLVQNAATIVMFVRTDGTMASVSGAVTRMLELDQEVIWDRPLTEIVHPDHRLHVAAAIHAAASAPSGDEPITVEAALLRADGRAVPFELTIVSLVDDPTVGGLVVSAHDISRLRAAQDALAELAHFDALTGLPNRRAFESSLQHEWTLTSRDGIDSYVVIGDLDGFKQLNDRYGHAAGDEALRQFAHALRVSVRETDVVARVGGDEFAAILVRCAGEAAALGFAAELDERLHERIHNLPIPVSASLGHASLRQSQSASDAAHQADLAMLAAKRARRA